MSDTAPRRRWWSYPLPWAVLVVGISLSVAAALSLRTKIRTTTAERFAALIEQQQAQLASRFNAYVQILRGAKGFWLGSQEVTRQEWHEYVKTLALEKNFPGIQGVGYASVVAPDALERYEQGMRTQAKAQPPALQALFRDFIVRPAGSRSLYTPVTYIEPFEERNLRAFGYDMWSEPVRRAALERARDTGEPALSGRVRLVQETETEVQPGFLVYLPIYRGGAEPQTVEERRERLTGYIYSPFRAYNFMNNALPSKGLYVQYAIYDGDTTSDDDLMFRSEEPSPPPRGQNEIVSQVLLAGHPWTVIARTGPLLNTGADRNVALLIGGAGTLVALLLHALALALARTRAKAEMLAGQMTADLRGREQELERVSERLKQSNEDLQQFVYAASHDLKEPLRTISSSLGLVVQRHAGRLDETGREFLGYASEAAQRLSGLIENLLEYSRVPEQAAPLDEVELDPVLDHALEDLSTLIAESNARIDRAPLPRVRANPEQILRVFENLIGNAVKYSRRQPTGPEVRIAARRDGARWVISIADNGIGIAPEYHDRIFTMFKRLHSRVEYEGSGVGLALCKRIVQRHGGDIWVESQPGAGATFLFSLPA